MVGLDTNIVLRYIVQDGERQSAIANRVFHEEISQESKGFVTTIVLCEVVWVLERFYKKDRTEIAAFLHALLEIDTLEFEYDRCVREAYRDYDNMAVDFSDSLLARVNHQYGAQPTLTFDRDASRLEYFRLAQ